MADAVDSKSTGGNIVRVQVPSPALLKRKFLIKGLTLIYFSIPNKIIYNTVYPP